MPIDIEDLDDLTPGEREALLAREMDVPQVSQQVIDDLVDKLVVACNELSGKPLRPYQEPCARRIFESLLLEDNATITALFSRQSGKTELVADVIVTCLVFFPRLIDKYPELLEKYADGFWVGIFAPTDIQAAIMFKRVVTRLTSKHAQAVLSQLHATLLVPAGERVMARGSTVQLLHCGSHVNKTTAHPRASIEGETYHLILIDEAQDVDDTVFLKSIVPMGTETGATFVLTGTPGRNKNVFHNKIQGNKREALSRGRHKKNHYEADWRLVSKYSRRYKNSAIKAMLDMGEDSDDFRLSYRCVAPMTRVLTADLEYIPAREVTEGMKLVGFDEERQQKGQHRKFKTTTVNHVANIRRPCYEMELSDGTQITASSDHQWLVSTAGRRTIWKTTEQLKDSDRIFRLLDVWDTDTSYEAGYLAAAFDGEGSLSHTSSGNDINLSFAQKNNAMLAQVQKYLTAKGFSHNTYTYENNENSHVSRLAITGGRANVLRFLGSIRPVRLLERMNPDKFGSIGRHDHVSQKFSHPKVVIKRFAGEQNVIAMETTSSTFVAEGLASHNCQWLLEQGMFTTSERLDALGDHTMQSLVYAYHATPVVAGIDCARKQDRTVVTVVFVDWDHPDQTGLYYHRILSWLDLEGMDWEDQYHAIVEFLRNYNLWKVGVDTNGLGDVVIDRLRTEMPDVEFVDLGSSPTDQSKRWKHLRKLMDRRPGMVSWPSGSKVKKLKVFRRFYKEMEDLEAVFQGPNLLGKAPEVKEAHDDYPDSLSMACILTTMEEDTQVTMSENVFYPRRH